MLDGPHGSIPTDRVFVTRNLRESRSSRTSNPPWQVLPGTIVARSWVSGCNPQSRLAGGRASGITLTKYWTGRERNTWTSLPT